MMLAGLSIPKDEPFVSDKEKSKHERQKQSSQASKRAASVEEAHPRIKIKKEKEDPGYDRYAGGSQQSCSEPERKHVSRTQRDEEEQRHQRSLGRRGEKSSQEHRGQNSSREERGEVSRKGDSFPAWHRARVYPDTKFAYQSPEIHGQGELIRSICSRFSED